MNNNPFSNNRAEYMKELWRYYVPNSTINFDTCQPLCIEGGRGTGKTTLFLCNCWNEKYSQYCNTNENGMELLLNEGIIGLYYKVDPTFVTSMQNGSRKNDFWKSLFCTYLSVEIIIELFKFLEEAKHTNKISADLSRNAINSYFRAVRGNENSKCYNFSEVLDDCEKVLDEIENCINSIDYSMMNVRLTSPGTIVKQIIEAVKTDRLFVSTVFKIYVDEYESMFEWQQKIVNTLVKASNKDIVYNIGVKTKGIKTYDTLSSGERIGGIHDFKYYRLDTIISEELYTTMVKKICAKRLEMFNEENKENSNVNTDIEHYLGIFISENEFSRYDKEKHPKFYNSLENKIKKETNDDIIIDSLCLKASPKCARLHLALLLRAKNYKPNVKKLYDCYTAWLAHLKNKDAQTYESWMHNAQNGLLFLLAKDYKKKKWYYGFDTYTQLSSGTVRYFLELCEQVFNIAEQNDYNFLSNNIIPPEIQTRAAQYVSKKQIMEIESYSEYGKQMLLFTISIGNVFKDLHRNENLTLGEPEPNHFSTNTTELLEETKISLGCAEKYSILQELPLTKEKEPMHTEIIDYHLNKIFAPYFEISYLKKRKLEFTREFLEGVLSGDKKRADLEVKHYLDYYWKYKNSITASEQINMFKQGELK